MTLLAILVELLARTLGFCRTELYRHRTLGPIAGLSEYWLDLGVHVCYEHGLWGEQRETTEERSATGMPTESLYIYNC